MMKFELSFECDNAAFEADLEAAVAKVLRHVANRVADGSVSGVITDRNGNTIGGFRLVEEEG